MVSDKLPYEKMRNETGHVQDPESSSELREKWAAELASNPNFPCSDKSPRTSPILGKADFASLMLIGPELTTNETTTGIENITYSLTNKTNFSKLAPQTSKDTYGRIVAINYPDGTKHEFSYANNRASHEIVKVVERDKTAYTVNKQGELVGPNGKLAGRSQPAISQDGVYSFKNADGDLEFYDPAAGTVGKISTIKSPKFDSSFVNTQVLDTDGKAVPGIIGIFDEHGQELKAATDQSVPGAVSNTVSQTYKVKDHDQLNKIIRDHLHVADPQERLVILKQIIALNAKKYPKLHKTRGNHIESGWILVLPEKSLA